MHGQATAIRQATTIGQATVTRQAAVTRQDINIFFATFKHMENMLNLFVIPNWPEALRINECWTFVLQTSHRY